MSVMRKRERECEVKFTVTILKFLTDIRQRMSPKYSLKIGKIIDHHSLKRIHRRGPETGIKVTLTPVTSAHPNTTLN